MTRILRRCAAARKRSKVGERTVVGLDALVVGDVVAVVAGRGKDGHQPERVDAEVRGGDRVAIVQVVELRSQALEVADAVAVRVGKAAHEDLVEDRAARPVVSPAGDGGCILGGRRRSGEEGEWNGQQSESHGEVGATHGNGYSTAVAEFDAARRAALMSDLIRPMLGRPVDLISFADVREHLGLASFVDRGIREVKLERIVGSLERSRDFNRAFLPREESLRERWEDVLRLAEGPKGFPPIDLYQVGDLYFVVDGHHRVSVARSMGGATIEARVREFTTPVQLGPETDLADLARVLRQRGRDEFLAATGIEPEFADELTASDVDAYSRLLEHIEVHRYFLGLEDKRDVTWSEAVASWRWSVYRPMIEAIRACGVLGDFPGHTETDLYLFTMDHLHALREQFGPGVSPERGVEELERRTPQHRRRRRASRRGGRPGKPEPDGGA